MEDIEIDDKENFQSVAHLPKVLLQPSIRKPLEPLRCPYNLRPRKDESLQKPKQELRKNPRRRSRSADDVHKLLEERAEVCIELSMVKKPAQKTNLIKKLSNRSSKQEQNEKLDLYADFLFDDDYLEDNYKYMLDYEDKYTFKRDILDKRIGYSNRLALIDWIVPFVVESRLAESTMFSAVRMFDKLLFCTDLSERKFGIAMLACLWIVSKLLDTNKSSAKLIVLLDSQYGRADIVRYEKKIINVLNFRLRFPEPVVFLSYYLKKYSLEQNKTIRCIAMFLLEYFTTLPEFSSSAPSLLAFAALYLALLKMRMLEQAASLRHYVGSHILNDDLLRKYSETMNCNVKQALRYRDTYGGIFTKYSTNDRMRASCLFVERRL